MSVDKRARLYVHYVRAHACVRLERSTNVITSPLMPSLSYGLKVVFVFSKSVSEIKVHVGQSVLSIAISIIEG